MLWRLRIMPFVLCLGATAAGVGCRSDPPMSLPDAGIPAGLAIEVSPPALVIRPGSSGRARFSLRDADGVAVPNYLISFTTVDESGNQVALDAHLSATQVLTEDDGSAALEVMIGNLAKESLPISFAVKASGAGAATAEVDVMVTTNAYSVEVVPVAAEDLLGTGAANVKTTRFLFYDDTTCGELDLTDLTKLAAASARPRPPRTVAAYSSWVFSGIAGTGSSAVVGIGLDSNTFPQIAGCVDIAGSSLSESQTMLVTLYMDRLFPIPRGKFDVSSDFVLTPAPTALEPAQSTWATWSRCGLDPARLWLDCTLDALSTTASDPLDCVPIEGSEGALGATIVARRGTVVAPASGTAPGTPSSGAGTSCRGSLDKSGNRSLESIIDGLFATARAQLQSSKLDAFSNEIASLLSEIRLDSQLSITDAASVNTFLVEHNLVQITFPGAIAPISLKAAALGLPYTSAELQATLKAGQLSLPTHAFTLRLGSTTRAAFEASSLKSRGAEDARSLVKAIFALAQWKDNTGTLTGCAALDAAVCDQLKQARGCLSNACQSGLTALASKLDQAFDGLDGDGFDFYLSGAAPVVDFSGNGLADALGLGGRAGTVSAGSGSWSAAFHARGGNYAVYGSWTASRPASTQ